MSKVLVLYYSSYGHIEKMAQAVAEGARSAGAEVDIKRVPETVPLEVAKSAHFKLDQAAPVATVAELENYDAIIVGTGTRFGRMSSQMAAFLDQAGGLWMRGALNGKVGGAFSCWWAIAPGLSRPGSQPFRSSPRSFSTMCSAIRISCSTS